MFDVGRLCVKIAGRDARKKCVVLEKIDDNYVLIDGQTRRRKVNIKHLEPLNKVVKLKKNASHSEVIDALKKEKIVVEDKKKKPKKAATKKTTEKTEKKEEKAEKKKVKKKSTPKKTKKKTEKKPASKKKTTKTEKNSKKETKKKKK